MPLEWDPNYFFWDLSMHVFFLYFCIYFFGFHFWTKSWLDHALQHETGFVYFVLHEELNTWINNGYLTQLTGRCGDTRNSFLLFYTYLGLITLILREVWIINYSRLTHNTSLFRACGISWKKKLYCLHCFLALVTNMTLAFVSSVSPSRLISEKFL